MPVSSRHIFRQGAVLAATGRMAMEATKQRLLGGTTTPYETPGPTLSQVLQPRHRELVRDYVEAVGGDLASYEGVIPPHMFPQWCFPLAGRTMLGIPYPLLRVMNGGCRLEARGPLPLDEALHVSARLENIDDNGRRAVLHQRLATGVADAPELVVAHLYAVVPLRRGGGQSNSDAARKERPRVPEAAREVQRWSLDARAGLDFAKLTGDFNPIHWLAPYARISGFKNTILHGFCTMARAIEGLRREVLSSSQPLLDFDCKFTRPLVLPAQVSLFVDDEGGVFVGKAPGDLAYLVGSYETETAPEVAEVNRSEDDDE